MTYFLDSLVIPVNVLFLNPIRLGIESRSENIFWYTLASVTNFKLTCNLLYILL